MCECSRAIVGEFKKLVEKHKQILIFDCSDMRIRALVAKFKIFLSDRISKREVYIIEITDSSDRQTDCVNHNYMKIDQRDFEECMGLYRMYEFTDCITLIMNNRQYPGLLNYLYTGLVSEDEFFEALLH